MVPHHVAFACTEKLAARTTSLEGREWAGLAQVSCVTWPCNVAWRPLAVLWRLAYSTCGPHRQVLPFLLVDGCLDRQRLQVVRRAAYSLSRMLCALYTPATVTMTVADAARASVQAFCRDAVAAFPIDPVAASKTPAGLGLLCAKVRSIWSRTSAGLFSLACC